MARKKVKSPEDIEAEKGRQFHVSPTSLIESEEKRNQIIEQNQAAIDKALVSGENKVTLNFGGVPVEFDLIIIPIDQHDNVEIHPSNARLQRHVNEISTRELTFEIQEQGQIYPIICVKIGGKYLVVDGSQRTFSLKLLHLPIIAFVVDLDAMEKKRAYKIIDSIEINSREFSSSSNTFKAESLYEKGIKYLEYINSSEPPKTVQDASETYHANKSTISIASRLARINSKIIDALPDPSGIGKKLAKNLIDLADGNEEKILQLCLENDELKSISEKARLNWQSRTKEQANANDNYLKMLADLCCIDKGDTSSAKPSMFKEMKNRGSQGRVTLNKKNKSFKLEIKEINESCYADIKEVMQKHGLEMESF